MQQPLFGGATDTISTYEDEYEFFTNPYNSWTNQEYYRQQIIAVAGKISKLKVVLNDTPGGGSKSYTFRLRKNGADTDLAVTITGDETEGEDTTHEVSVSPGDLISMSAHPANGPVGRSATKWRSFFEATLSGETALISSLYSGISTSSDNFASPVGCLSSWSVGIDSGRITFPKAGTISHLYVSLQNAPGSGKSRTFTVRKNMADQSLSCTIADENTTGNNTTNSVSVSAGDDIQIGCSPSGTPASSWVRIGLKWTPQTDGECVAGSYIVDQTSTLVEYNYIDKHRYSFTTAEANRLNYNGACRAKQLHVKLSGSGPGEGKSLEFIIRKNRADTDLAVTISDTDTQGVNSSDTVDFGDLDEWSFKVVPTNSPNACSCRLSIIIEVVGGAIVKEVTDTVGLFDSILTDKTFVVSDSIGVSDIIGKDATLQIQDSISLAEQILRDKTFVISDGIGLAEHVLRDKTFSLSDVINLADVVYRDKTFTISDSITLVDVVEKITELLKEVVDTISLSDAVSTDKVLLIPDLVTLNDEVFRHKTFIVTDAMQLTDSTFVDKLVSILDTIQLTDTVVLVTEWPGVYMLLNLKARTLQLAVSDRKQVLGLLERKLHLKVKE